MGAGRARGPFSLDSAWSKWERGNSYFEMLKDELAGPIPNIPWAHTHTATCEAQPGGLEYHSRHLFRQTLLDA